MTTQPGSPSLTAAKDGGPSSGPGPGAADAGSASPSRRGRAREAILAAVEAMAAERRYHEITLDEVAAAAHVGKGTIYRYFRDKEDLFRQLAEEGHRQLCATIEACAEATDAAAFDERLRQVCTEISAFFRKRKAVLRLMSEQEGRLHALGADRRAAWKMRRRELAAAVATVLAAGARRGQLREDIPLTVQAGFLLSLLRTRGPGFAVSEEERPEIATIVDVFLRGAGACPDAGSAPDGTSSKGPHS